MEVSRLRLYRATFRGSTLPGTARRWGRAQGGKPACHVVAVTLLSIVAAGAAVAVAAAGLQPGAAQAKPQASQADKVVIIVVDSLSKEIVDKYDMKNVQALMARRRRHPARLPRPHRLGHGRDPQRDHLGPAAQAHGVDRRGLPRRRRHPARPRAHEPGDTSTSPATWRTDQMLALQQRAGYPKLADYLGRQTRRQGVHDQPEGVRRVGVRRRRRDSIITFSSATCNVRDGAADRQQLARPGRRQRAVVHLSRPTAAAAIWVHSGDHDNAYDTDQAACAACTRSTDDRYVDRPRRRPTRAATSGRPTRRIDVMDNEPTGTASS